MSQSHHTEQLTCRICQLALGDESELISFNDIAIAGAYISNPDASVESDPVAPFTVLACPDCGLVQLRERLLPDFYHAYQFVSAVAESYVGHLKQIANYLLDELPAQARVLEIGSNDGTLLQILQNGACEVEGFEPARVPAAVATSRGIKTHNKFFSAESAATADLQQADAIVIRHVLEHIDDFEPIFDGINFLASQATKLIVEVPDLRATLEECLYANFYHPHPCYFDLQTLSTLLQRNGWYIRKQGLVDIFGGSLVIEATRQPGPLNQFSELTESAAEKISHSMLDIFMSTWKTNIKAAQRFFSEQKRGELVVGYGAAERTMSYIGTVGLDAGQISCLYDRNEALSNLVLPGSRIPIKPADAIAADKPDVVVIFASSYEDEIHAQLRRILPEQTHYVSLKGSTPILLTA